MIVSLGILRVEYRRSLKAQRMKLEQTTASALKHRKYGDSGLPKR